MNMDDEEYRLVKDYQNDKFKGVKNIKRRKGENET